MKLAVCGKGGSGKSTVAALLAKEFQRRSNQIIVIDSDESNSGLHWMLGIEKLPLPLMELVGGKRKIQDKMTVGFSIEGGEEALSIWKAGTISVADIPSAHVAGNDACRLVVTGKIDRTFEGCACPMGVVTREFLKKLKVDYNQIAIVDMEAGVEHFGRGIETSLDAVFVVVEPSLESLSLAQKIKELTHWAGAHFAGAVINKVMTESTLARISDELKNREIRSLGCLRYNNTILNDGLFGRPVDLDEKSDEVVLIADNILDAIIKRGL